jgi:hypothetical protein
MVSKLALGLAVVLMVQLAFASGPLGTELRHNPAYICHVDGLLTLWAIDRPPGEIEDHTVTFDDVGTTTARVQFRNLTGGVISSVALVVEYLDKQGGIIDTVPMVGATRELIAEFRTPFPVQRLVGNPWAESVTEEASVQIDGVKDGVRTSVCPTSARITFVKIQWTDGTVQSFFARDWQVPPIPHNIPRVGNGFPKLGAASASALLTRVRIDTTGHVTDVRVSGDEQSTKLFEWFDKWMRQSWTFHPAVYAGRRVDAELEILFRVHVPSSQDASENETTPTPVTLIQLLPKATQPGWLVYYGTLIQGDAVK